MKSFIRLIAIGIPAALTFYSCQKGTQQNQLNTSQRLELLNAKPAGNIMGAVSVFSSGFNNPRGLKWGPDGYLYVAEGGTGGTTVTNQCAPVVFPIGPYKGSLYGGRISRVNMWGVRTTVTDSLPTSSANELIGGYVEGAADVAFIGNQLYALLAGAGCSHSVPQVPNGIVKVDVNTGKWWMVANLSVWQQAHPVKNPEPDDFEPDGTWYSMISLQGDLYAVEPNHGELVKVTTDGNISRVIDISASQGHIVPTALSYHGNFYVGNLYTFPIPGGASKIFKITPSGQIKDWATGLNTVLGLVFDDRDRMYVLEMTDGAPYPTSGLGKVLRIDPNGDKTVIASGLDLPTGLTMGPDGNLYVSNVGLGPNAIGGGQVLKITLP
jgi:hypothetical protein